MDNAPNTPLPCIALFPVESTRILAAGYDPESQTLAIQFPGNSRTYRYANVPPAVWDGFQKAKSKGAYFHSAILNQFDYSRIEEDGTISKAANATVGQNAPVTQNSPPSDPGYQEHDEPEAA